MKKIGSIVKQATSTLIKNRIADSKSVFIIKYSGLSSPDICALRQSLRKNNASLFVVKNSVARIMLKETGKDGLISAVEGPCGFIFVKEEPVLVSKLLCAFIKDHEKLKLDGGLLEDKILSKTDIEILAKLPAKEVLHAQVVSALNAPIVKLVMVLNRSLQKLVICLDQIKDKKSKEGGQ